MLKFFAMLMLLASATVHAQTALQSDLPLKYLEQANAESQHQPLVIFLTDTAATSRTCSAIKDDLPATYTLLVGAGTDDPGGGQLPVVSQEGRGRL